MAVLSVERALRAELELLRAEFAVRDKQPVEHRGGDHFVAQD